MNRGPAAWHRLTVGLFGLIFVVVGVGALLWRADVAPVRDMIDRIDQGAAARLAETGWWPAVLVAVAVIALLWAWRLIAATIRPGKVEDLVLDGSDQSGTLTVAPKLIAAAVGQDLSADPTIDRVAAQATDDRGRKIIRLTVTADPAHSYAEIASIVGDAVEDIRDAVDGSGIHVQAMVHLERQRS
ncbi:hypothetical protein [Gordonia insulae]|uniref:Alkaline shock response membrane anchor protein AmaP n=1 Tax=Gordonia insulae TaxID=2420509 RepID=A0A3G8JWX6_9ACTN|nr:hypothetical protein [Gordonia insulae]AZG48720.1 hypothetical protein D7316_05341 [Gordonia insulae]